ncbi:TPA: hypothetical protein EYO12_03755 [Candidatus Saccharibacteria bacterium]|nr:hypothetical protein [Candidatus Saccharibacteria bacterium]HIO87846.1 hypothetical protein [Candidatus Saccharibacteria bacterium]
MEELQIEDLNPGSFADFVNNKGLDFDVLSPEDHASLLEGFGKSLTQYREALAKSHGVDPDTFHKMGPARLALQDSIQPVE